MFLVELLGAFVWVVLPALLFVLVCAAIEGAFKAARWLRAHRRGIRAVLLRGTRGDVVTPRPQLPDPDPIDNDEPIDAMVIRHLRGEITLRCGDCSRAAPWDTQDPHNRAGRRAYLWRCPGCGYTFCARCMEWHGPDACVLAQQFGSDRMAVRNV